MKTGVTEVGGQVGHQRNDNPIRVNVAVGGMLAALASRSRHGERRLEFEDRNIPYERGGHDADMADTCEHAYDGKDRRRMNGSEQASVQEMGGAPPIR